MSSRRLLLVATTIVLSFSPIVLGQQTPTPPTAPEPVVQRQGFRRPKGERHRFGKKERRLAFGRLNLTEQQRQQQRAILQRHLEATKTQREQLFQLREKKLSGTLTPEDMTSVNTLRAEVRSSRKALREETLNLLTPDQRAQFKTQRREFREERLNRGREKLKSPQL